MAAKPLSSPAPPVPTTATLIAGARRSSRVSSSRRVLFRVGGRPRRGLEVRGPRLKSLCHQGRSMRFLLDRIGRRTARGREDGKRLSRNTVAAGRTAGLLPHVSGAVRAPAPERDRGQGGTVAGP